MKSKVAANKRWVIGERDREDILEQILINRKIDAEEREVFLNPDYKKGLHDPFLMKGVKEAVERLVEAINNKEKIGVFGDYDADGIPATALVSEILEKHGLEVLTFIPKRSEGYGLNHRGIDWFAENNVKILVTVDLGITAKEEVKYAKEKGLEVIVTDHHEPIKELLPEVLALIDPKQKDCSYPFKELSGTAVAFKLMMALCCKTKRLNDNDLKWYLDLVGISTFCDVVPLVDENRVLAKYGLIVLQKTRRVGLTAMYKAAKIDPKTINPYTVGFVIGPRLNAPGRMGDCSDSLKLLMTKDMVLAEEVAGKLEKANVTRQNMLKRAMAEADDMVEEKGLYKNKIILVSGNDWSEGIVGLVAGRLTEKYARPTLVIGWQEGVGIGSARSIDNLSMVETLNKCKKYLVKHGGHAKAAGLTIKKEDLEKFYEQLLIIGNEELKEEDLVGKISCEMEIGFSEIDWELVEKLDKMEPYGLGNPKPVFYTKNVQCVEKKKLGKNGEHLRMTLSDGENTWPAIAFGLGEREDFSMADNVIEMVYTMEKDTFRGGKNLQLKVVDFRLGVR